MNQTRYYLYAGDTRLAVATEDTVGARVDEAVAAAGKAGQIAIYPVMPATPDGLAEPVVMAGRPRLRQRCGQCGGDVTSVAWYVFGAEEEPHCSYQCARVRQEPSDADRVELPSPSWPSKEQRFRY